MEDLTRRTFLGGLAALPAMDVLNLFAQDVTKSGGLKEVDFYKKLEDQKTQCLVCPMNCILSPGQT